MEPSSLRRILCAAVLGGALSLGACGGSSPAPSAPSQPVTGGGATTPPVFATESHFAVDRNTAAPNRADLSLTVAGQNPLLIVAFHAETDGGETNWSVTCNGVAGTLVANTDGYSGGAGNQRFRIYSWTNPAQGPAAITVQNGYVGSNELSVAAVLLTNVSQATPLGAVVLDVSTADRTAESETVPTTTTDLVVHVIADALYTRGTLSGGETSVSVANDGLHSEDGDASLWISTAAGKASSTTVASTGWASRVVNGVAVVVHGASATSAQKRQSRN